MKVKFFYVDGRIDTFIRENLDYFMEEPNFYEFQHRGLRTIVFKNNLIKVIFEK